ncbi:MAG: response regulator [Desulfocapsaceae bacterium]|nr:response regulator [Desulfocapsaceae bacterium]
MNNFKLNNFAICFVVIALISLSVNGIILLRVLNLHMKTLKEQQMRQESLQIAYGIQQETAALSRMVRAYTTSGDNRYLRYYYDIIDIRNGKKPPPENYNATYWAEVMAGKREHFMPNDRPGISILDRMKSHGFSHEEFMAIDKVLSYSGELYEQDQIAFAATQGLYDPVHREFVNEGEPQRQFANDFVYSPNYLQLEYQLLRAIDNFVLLTDERTQSAVKSVSIQLNRSIYAAIAILAITVVIVLIAMGVLRNLVLAPMKNLMNSALELGSGHYNHRVGIAQGVYELQLLEQTFNTMAQNIQEDILQREQIQNALEIATIKAEASTKAKSLFLANMSHEIRTPMNVIIGMSHLALNTDLDARQRDYIGKMQIAAQSLLGVINDILDFSKIEAGKLELNIVPFQIEGVVDNVLTLLRQRAMEKGIELLLEIKSPQLLGNLGTFLGDPLRLGQILTNLLTNAVKFTKKGSVITTIEEMSQQENRRELQFCIEDTGIGMTSEQLASLFQEFYQADGTTTRKYGGTGLGLSITKRLITQMGGSIFATSQLDQGSKFIFTVPLSTPVQPLPETSPEVSAQGLKALIIDSHPPARRVLRSMLGNFGIDSLDADSEDAALYLLNNPENIFDMLFIEWGLPGMGGQKLMSAVEKLSLRPDPILVVISAHDGEKIYELCAERQSRYFISKPVLPRELRKLIRKIKSKNSIEETPSSLFNKTNLKGMCVLVVEDNLFNQQIASESLSLVGVHVDVANNGQEAIEMISSKQDDYYDAVLMDIQMPVMDGYETTKHLRSQEKYDALPIIAMTAHAMIEEQQHCRAIGMNMHIAKPINLKDLYQALAAYYSTQEAVLLPGSDFSAQQNSTSCEHVPDEIQSRDPD